MKGRARSKERRDARYVAAVKRQIVFNRNLAGRLRPYSPVENFLRAGDTADMEKFATPVDVYFMHNVLTPANARVKWEDVLVVPAVGETVAFEGAGYMGAAVEWTVARHEWLSGHAVTLHMTGPIGEVAE